MAELSTLRKFEALSPFEIKNELRSLAKEATKTTQSAFLDAGRGNPNWIATTPREGFFLLGQFAILESKRVMEVSPGIGGMPKASGVAGRLDTWLSVHQDMPGAPFLSEMVKFAVKTFKFDPDAFVHELVDSIIGDNYPVPDRMLVHNERDRARIPDVGGLRRAASQGQVRPLRGRGRDCRHVLHLQIPQSQSLAVPGRHHRARHAHLHAIPRDDAPRGLRPQGREDRHPAGEPLSVHRRGDQETRRSEDQGACSSSTRATRAAWRWTRRPSPSWQSS